MKVKLLLLEGVEKEINEDIQQQLMSEESMGLSEQEREYNRVIAQMMGKETEEPENKTIYVDMTKFYKETDFYFKKEDVAGLFMSTKTFRDQKIMVIILGNEYDCVYEEKVFNKLVEFLNN